MNQNTTSTDQNQNETVQIPLSKGYFSTIDREDFERVSQHKWTALKTPWTVYARRTWVGPEGKQHSMYLHRFIMQAEKGIEIDHRDSNGLNNVRSNLRFATKSDNSQSQKKKKSNTSGHKGVRFNKQARSWVAFIGANNTQYHLGSFKTKQEAIAARIAAGNLLHKDFHKIE